ncbi:MAG: chemotaxis protein CheW [Gammaproteobacteria bacterium]
MLLLRLGADCYALDARQVVEVIPVVRLKRIPPAPAYVAGMFNYRGKPVPVIDLCQLVEGRAAHVVLSSRIIMVNYPVAGESHLLGILAEGTTEVVRREGVRFLSADFEMPGSPYLGRVIQDADGLIQEIEVEPRDCLG